jgi:hypothetical protein
MSLEVTIRVDSRQELDEGQSCTAWLALVEAAEI